MIKNIKEIVKTGKTIAENVQNKQAVAILKKLNGISEKFISAYEDGKMTLTEKVISPYLYKRFASIKGVELEHVTFSDNAIILSLSYKRFFLRFNSEMQIYIQSFVLSSKQQKLACNVELSNIHGKNWISNAVFPIVELLVGKFVKGEVSQNEIVTSLSQNGNTYDVQIDLSNIKSIKALLKKLPLIGIRPIDLFKITDISHSCDGLTIFFDKEELPGQSQQTIGI